MPYLCRTCAKQFVTKAEAQAHAAKELKPNGKHHFVSEREVII